MAANNAEPIGNFMEENKEELITSLTEYQMPKFKCVCLAKCGDLLLVDDQNTKVTVLSTKDLSL